MKTFLKMAVMVGAVSLSLIGALRAAAHEWVLVSDSRLTMTYADRETLSGSEGDDLRKVWMKTAFKNDTEYDYFLDLYEYECANKRYRVVKGSTHYKNGTTVDAKTDSSWRYGVPDSTAEKAIAFVCP